MKQYAGMGPEELFQSISEFLNEVVPVAEEMGMRLGIHPDDPPFPLFGLPRIISTAEDVAAFLDAYDSPANGLTFCVGSYGSRADNDLVAMIEAFAPRIHFMHLRNVAIEAPGIFHEAEHLGGGSDMVAIARAVMAEEKRRAGEGREDAQIPMRPDHGHLLSADPMRNTNPGYSYIGRLKGLAEMRGVMRTVAALGA
jgi:mannonate dehydratase